MAHWSSAFSLNIQNLSPLTCVQYSHHIISLFQDAWRIVHRKDAIAHEPFCCGLLGACRPLPTCPYHTENEVWYRHKVLRLNTSYVKLEEWLMYYVYAPLSTISKSIVNHDFFASSPFLHFPFSHDPYHTIPLPPSLLSEHEQRLVHGLF